MSTIISRPAPRLTAVALCLSAGVLAGCGPAQPPDPDPGTAQSSSSPGLSSGSPSATDASPGPKEQADSVYVGAYDEAIRVELSAYRGQQVSLTGQVRDLIRSRSSYELANPTDPDLDPILMSAAYAVPDLQVGDTVQVTGILREGFEPPVVEEAVEGGEEAGFYDQHLGQPYLDEAHVEIVDSPGQ